MLLPGDFIGLSYFVVYTCSAAQ